jgi:transcriptional regulator with XRE-family HTH domain
MFIDPLKQFEDDCAKAGVSVPDVLKDAGVAQSTWWRWKNDRFEPRGATLRKLREALDRKSRRRSPSAQAGAAA